MQIRIATRASDLARWQADFVASRLGEAGIRTEIVPVSTSGDRDKSTPLHVLGGKGVFVKEVQAAVIDGRADIAVHSAKDLPAITPSELALAAVPVRADPRDALIGLSLDSLTSASLVATGSVRRRAQLAALVPGVSFTELRGNMATRIGRADEFDAIVVAAAALDRLELDVPDLHLIDQAAMVPQVGQGALAVECRVDDASTRRLLAEIDVPAEHLRLECERGFLRELGGDCSLPAGAHATLRGEVLSIDGFLSNEALDARVRTSRTSEVPLAALTYGVEHHDMVDALGRQLAGELVTMMNEADPTAASL